MAASVSEILMDHLTESLQAKRAERVKVWRCLSEKLTNGLVRFACWQNGEGQVDMGIDNK